MRKLPIKLKIFLSIVYLFTLGSMFFFVNKVNYVPISLKELNKYLFFIILIALTESFTVLYRKISFSTSFAVQLASFILFGPLITIIIIIVGFSFRVQKLNDGYDHILNTPWYGTIFNYCVLTLPIIYGSYFYYKIGGTFNIVDIQNNISHIIVFSSICFLGNTFLISTVFSILNSKNIFYSFTSNVKLGLLNIFAMAPFGIILAIVFDTYSYLGVLIVLFPTILARYTFSLYIDSKTQYAQTVDAIMHAMEARDKYTEGHSQRVAEISTLIARELKYNEWKIEQLNIAAMLHDIGKIGIDDSILNKPGKLTNEEFDIIKKHPEIGFNIIKEVKNLGYASSIIRYHHERFDGRGYPEGKKTEELELDVFIVQLADSIDAMATDRPYRKALAQEVIIEEVKKNKGTQFHPRVVDAYLRALEKQTKLMRG